MHLSVCILIQKILETILILCAINDIVQVITLVSGAFKILNLLSTSMSVILASIIASRMPIQILGPLPNGMKAPGWMEDFWDLLNLQQKWGSVWYRAVCGNVCMCVSLFVYVSDGYNLQSHHIYSGLMSTAYAHVCLYIYRMSPTCMCVYMCVMHNPNLSGLKHSGSVQQSSLKCK